MNTSHSLRAYLLGRPILGDLIHASIAFGQGALYPIVLLFSRLREWNRQRKPSRVVANVPAKLAGAGLARHASLRKPVQEGVGRHAHEPAGTV